MISQAVGRFPKWEFDTMVLGMSERVWWTQKAPRIIQIGGFKELRGSLKLHVLIIGLINRAAYSSKEERFLGNALQPEK